MVPFQYPYVLRSYIIFHNSSYCSSTVTLTVVVYSITFLYNFAICMETEFDCTSSEGLTLQI